MKETITPGIDHEVLSLMTDIAYCTIPSWYGSTRRNLYMDIIAPKVRENHRKLPLIVWFCGGAYRVMDKSVWIPELMYFARRGYVVASVQYRTSNETCFPDPLIDAKTAVRWLKAHADDYCIDPDKVCVMGESAGGTLACLTGLTAGRKEFEQGDFLEQDSSVQAVVDFYGITELRGLEFPYVTQDVPAWTLEDFVGIGYSEEKARMASAISYVSDDTPPVMILHGGADVVVPIAQSELFYEKLQEQGVDSDFYTVAGAGHGADAFYQEETLALVDQFLKRAFH